MVNKTQCGFKVFTNLVNKHHHVFIQSKMYLFSKLLHTIFYIQQILKGLLRVFIFAMDKLLQYWYCHSLSNNQGWVGYLLNVIR